MVNDFEVLPHQKKNLRSYGGRYPNHIFEHKKYKLKSMVLRFVSSRVFTPYINTFEIKYKL